MRSLLPFTGRRRAFFALVLAAFSQAVFAQIRIPVVVHVVSMNPESVTDAQVLNGIADLNAAFSHSAPYASGPGANTGIQFVLARTDPQGGITTGITRTVSSLGWMDMELDDAALKTLVSWDQNRYLNIWKVDSIEGEMFTSFGCGNWTREQPTGYASTPGNATVGDGIVIANFNAELARYAGTYFGLKYIFEQGCQNNDCSVDGDGVCDTPPQSARSASCGGIQNTCSSDTLSGFSTDQPDLAANFMSFSPCLNMFTEGQAAKMRSMLASLRPGLLGNASAVNPPCGESIRAQILRVNWNITPGVVVDFSSSATGAANYEWRLDGLPVGGNSPALTYVFPGNGEYLLSLKAYNGNSSCYASDAQKIRVTCGTEAAFTPGKRIIASKYPYYVDTIRFVNKSTNADSYEWLVGNDTGMVEQLVSTEKDLDYPYLNKGVYTVRLVAIKGGCRDTSETFTHTVQDPVVDGYLNFYSADCFENDRLRVSIGVCNAGVDTLFPGIPVRFYQGNPFTGPSVRLDDVYVTTDTVAGSCCGPSHVLILNVRSVNVDEIYAVFNDNGTAIPVQLPNTSMEERDYGNNLSVARGFRFTAKINPSVSTLLPGDSLRLNAVVGPGAVKDYTWMPAGLLSCSNCPDPLFVAKASDTSVKLVARSVYGCSDSAVSIISVPPADDFTVQLKSADCAKKDSVRVFFELCNQFFRGVLPAGLRVSFYDGDPISGGNRLGNEFALSTAATQQCGSYEALIPVPQGGSVFAIVNGPLFMGTPGQVFTESNLENNSSTIAYRPFSVIVTPQDTLVTLNSQLPLRAMPVNGQISEMAWVPSAYLSCADCTDPLLTVKSPGLLTFTGRNLYGCVASDSVMIRVLVDGPVRIPNAFTPNGDGKNDVFYVLGGRDIAIIRDFSIYGRYGQQVFHKNDLPANDPSFGWRGEDRGQKMPPGTYVYLVIVRFRDGTEQAFRGTVTLIR